MEDEYPTNTAHPDHNPSDPNEPPYTADQWKDGHLADDIDANDVSDDQWVDSRGRPFDPTAGNTSPEGGDKCNATLLRWKERYGERRYCGQYNSAHFGADVEHDYCSTHEDRAALTKKAEEVMQTGLSAQTRDHVYRKLPDWQRLYIYGLYEGLMGQSVHEFAPEYELKAFDFEDAPMQPNIGGQDGPIYHIQIPHATENLDREVALWLAAVDGVKLELANAELSLQEEDDEVGEVPVMSTSTVDNAQLTSPTEDNPTQEFRTLKSLVEHPLNMAYSRVIGDRKDLLKYGGIPVDGELSDNDGVLDNIDSLTVVEADTSAETPTADKADRAGLNEIEVE